VDDEKPATPCGACRQVLHEFSSEQGVLVQVGNPQDVIEYSLADLLPKAF
jgi:cytidine deaminase